MSQVLTPKELHKNLQSKFEMAPGHNPGKIRFKGIEVDLTTDVDPAKIDEMIKNGCDVIRVKEKQKP